jgi:hypothetical protein
LADQSLSLIGNMQTIKAPVRLFSQQRIDLSRRTVTRACCRSRVK